MLRLTKNIFANKSLICIVVVGLLLRIVNLSNVPPALNWDEISHGFSAYSILKTGSDEWGQRLPIVNFRAYGDYPLPLNLYLTLPSIFIFGLNEFSIRFPHALLGGLTVLATYFLVYGLTKKKDISLLASFLIAIEPWSLFTSRIVLQQNLSVFFLAFSSAAFINRKANKYLLPLAFALLFLTLFAYHSTRIFSPLFLVATLFIYRKELIGQLRGWKTFLVLLMSGLFLVIAGAILLEPTARARSKWLFIIDQTAISRIIELRQKADMSAGLERMLYNRPTYFVYQFTRNYFEYLSPKFLFQQGGTQYQYSLPGFGLSYLVNLPFFYLGIFILLKRAFKGSKDYIFILTWLVLSPIAGSLTNEHFAVTRASTMLPLPQMLSAIGVYGVANLMLSQMKSFQKVFGVCYGVIVVVMAANYLLKYFSDYPKKFSQSWQYGYKQVVNYSKDNYQKYDKIIVTKKYGEPHAFFLFFWPWDPQNYKEDLNLIRFRQSDWYWVDRFAKFYFVNDWQIPHEEWEDFVLESGQHFECVHEKCLLITSPANFPKGWQKVKTVNFLDTTAAFEIYEN